MGAAAAAQRAHEGVSCVSWREIPLGAQDDNTDAVSEILWRTPTQARGRYAELSAARFPGFWKD